MLDRMASGVTQLFPLWAVIVGILSLYEPSYFLWYGKDAIGVGLGKLCWAWG